MGLFSLFPFDSSEQRQKQSFPFISTLNTPVNSWNGWRMEMLSLAMFNRNVIKWRSMTMTNSNRFVSAQIFNYTVVTVEIQAHEYDEFNVNVARHKLIPMLQFDETMRKTQMENSILNTWRFVVFCSKWNSRWIDDEPLGRPPVNRKMRNGTRNS